MSKASTAMVTIAVVMTANSALAQDPYDAGIFADVEGTISTRAVAPGEVFEVYAVAFDLDEEVKALELSINGLLETGVQVLQIDVSGFVHELDFLTLPDLLFGTGGCFAVPSAFSMVKVTALALSPIPNDTAICIGGTTPSSFNGPPGYAQCDDDIIPFGIAQNGEGRYPDGCLILNATQEGPVETQRISFGSMKGLYRIPTPVSDR